ncbi:MAG: response regulator [Stygiobacter sp.]
MDSPINILLIEDDIDDVNLIQRAINKSKLNVNLIILEDGEKAVNYFFNNSEREKIISPKFVILDLKLPKISGLEILKRVKLDPKYKLLPLIILTSSKEKKDIEECYKNYANSYVVKPIDYEKFNETIISILNYWINFNESL